MTKWKTHIKRSPKEGKYTRVRDMLAFVSTKRGEFAISRRAWHEIKEPRHIKFVTDGDGRGGFMACESDDPGAYKVQDIERGNVLRIGCKSVTNLYGLSDEDGTRLYALQKEGDVLVFNLAQGYDRI
jgi:hypothetical protein